NTEINSINVSNLTVHQAHDKLKDTFSNKKLTIEENGKVWEEIAKSELGYKDDFSADLSRLLNQQNAWSWGMNYVSASEKQEIDPQDTDHQKLDETLASTTNK
ncbi:hypothetical protein NON27_26530, partial [Vibrio parahaemolyticus]|nr:hypothetical protein [Vibrio parahaemolyticus]